MKTAVRGTLALWALSLFAGQALAQQKPAASTDEAARGTLEQDIEKFWGKRRQVTVVQKRKFPKVGRWELSVHFGTIPNDPFVNYIPVGARASYHFKEWLGGELGFFYMPSYNTSLADGIRDIGKGSPYQLQVTLQEKQKMLFHIGATFSLLYGKVAMMQTSLSHFDVFLTAGPSFHIVDPPVDANGRETGASGFRVGGYFGAGMKFFINDFFGVRFDIRQYLFPKSGDAGGGVHKPTELSLGATFFLG